MTDAGGERRIYAADVATLTKRAHDTGWEQGTADACNAILAWLERNGPTPIAQDIREAWEDGVITLDLIAAPEEPEPQPPAVEQTLLATPKLTREIATQFGFTGDECGACHQFTMVRNGTCLKCTSCGTTTGCS